MLFRPYYEDFGTDPTTDTGVDTGSQDTGNISVDHGEDTTGGCGCSSTPSPKSGWLFAAMGAVFMGRRRRA
jgi:MYXO-CTERM domain-containing protein